MRVNDFAEIVNKISKFKIRLEQEGIAGQQQQVILKIYINDLTTRINTKFLRVV